jgi:hypothetical protein
MKTKVKTRVRKMGYFEYGYVSKPSQIFGVMLPEFQPHWWVQYLGNGLQWQFETKRECLDWMRDWGRD